LSLFLPRLVITASVLTDEESIPLFHGMLTGKKQLVSQTWKRFRSALHILLVGEQRTKAKVFLFTLLVLMLSINGLNVLNSYVGRDFMSAIESKNRSAFGLYALIYSGVFLASTAVLVFYRFTEERLGILWREKLTWRFIEAYMWDRAYFHLDSATGVANPDQRITEDVKAFTTTTLSFTLLILNGTITAVSFSWVLWSISPSLFAVAVVYALCGSGLTIFLGRPLMRLNYNQFDMEANFRADLIHVRENAESIALAHHEGRFKTRLRTRLDSLIGNFRRIIRINRNLGFFTNGYNYFIQIIPALIIAPFFIAGKVEFGVITQSTMAFATLLGSFSLIITQFQSISTFSAVTARLHVLTEAIEKSRLATPSAIQVSEGHDHVSYEHITLHSSDNTQLLIEDLNLEIQKGSLWLVMSEYDAPLLALFRASASMWDVGNGKITRPEMRQLLFLPERPYLPPGALRDALLRPGWEATVTDAQIWEVLKLLDLESVVDRVGGLDVDCHWDDVFSITEQHLLSVVRVYLSQPKFVFLDRPGSSLPKARIERILEMLKTQGIGVVIFSKNADALLHFDSCLTIQAEGKWTIHEIQGGKNSMDLLELRDLSC